MTATDPLPRPIVPRPDGGFVAGYTAILGENDPGGLGFDFGIRIMAAGEALEENHAKESAWVLLQGKADLRFGARKAKAARASLFDEGPSVLHVCPETRVTVRSLTATEWAVARVTGQADLPPALFLPGDVKSERHGEGIAQGACVRCYRSVIHPAEREDSGFTIGETITFPGRWSCYPPQHHDQPELHHYRFTLPQGYGLAESGVDVVRVRHGDTLRIPGGSDHSHVAAPGYGMYSLCVLRNLPGNPYSGSRLTKEHTWMLDLRQQGWVPPAPPKPSKTKKLA